MPPLAISLASLVLPLAIGALAGRVQLFAEPARTIDALNRFALHVAFPALVGVALSDPDTPIARQPAFLAIVPASLLASLAVVRALSALRPAWRSQAGTLALVVAFGNTAYLGLPYVEAVLGEPAVASAAVAVALHVACAMTLGPLLLARWSEAGRGGREALARVLRQPLLWSPLVGLASRALPLAALEPLRATIDPLGRTAAPLSMFLLGLYLWENRARRSEPAAIAAHVAARLVLVPAITLGLAFGARAAGWLGLVELRVLALLAAMPAAITTFAIALEQDVGSERVAAVIVASTVASVFTLGALTWALLALA